MKNTVAAALGVVVFAGMASARPMFHYEFPLDGLQEVPPVATPGTGMAVVDYNSDTNFLSWSLTFSGLIGTTTAAHFHGAALPGASAGVRIGISIPLGVTSGAAAGSAMVGSEALEGELLGGLWYLNVHTSFRPGGEIRGQVVPTPGAAALLGAAGLLGIRRRRA